MADPRETNFGRGFRAAIALWKSGMTFELISHKADEKTAECAYEYARGMVAATEALYGWLDSARREARAWGVPSREIEALIVEAQAA